MCIRDRYTKDCFRDLKRVVPEEAAAAGAPAGELGAAVGDPGLLKDFLGQALTAYQAFTEKVVAAAVEADGHWSRAQVGVGLLRLCALPRPLHLFRALPPRARPSSRTRPTRPRSTPAPRS